MAMKYTSKHAKISPCGLYRYALTRSWKPGPVAAFGMLNPSTADADADDNTIGRVVWFADREGFGTVYVFNLFSFRSTQPRGLLLPEPADKTGGEANRQAVALALRAELIVCAWGKQSGALGKLVTEQAGRTVVHLQSAAAKAGVVGRKLMCLGRASDGSPRHPLYLKGESPLTPYANL